MSANAIVDRTSWLSVALATFVMSSSMSATSRATSLRVVGTAQFQSVRSEALPSGAKLTGTLRDDSRQALAGQAVSLLAAGAKASACDTGEPSGVTDSAGRFCFILSGSLPDRATLQFDGSDFYVRAQRDVQIELNPSPLTLALDVGNASWDRNGPARHVQVSLQGTSDDYDDMYEVRLAVLRPGEPERLLAEVAVIRASENAHFEVAPLALGAPGPSTLVAIVGDDPGQPLARTTAQVLVRSRATLSWGVTPEAIRPELGFDLTALVSTPGLVVGSGSVELISGSKLLDSVAVRDGSASLHGRFLAPAGERVSLVARYVPDQAWLDPGEPIELDLPLARLSPWLHAPWVILVALAAAWIFRAWRRPGRNRSRPIPTPPATAATPHVSVVAPATGHSGWSGTVRDLHTRAPIGGARLVITQPAVDGAAIVLEAVSDSGGQFELAAVSSLPEGARLTVQAADHSTLTQAIPPRGRLEVGLSTRRRSLLAHLLRWAESRGLSDPVAGATPQEIAGRLHAQRSPNAHWPLDVERAVFDREAPTAQREEQLVTASPAVDLPAPLKR